MSGRWSLSVVQATAHVYIELHMPLSAQHCGELLAGLTKGGTLVTSPVKFRSFQIVACEVVRGASVRMFTMVSHDSSPPSMQASGICSPPSAA